MKETKQAYSLLTLNSGEQAEIVQIDCEEVELALLKMGISVGATCQVSGGAALKDPVAFRTSQVKVFLRKKDASKVWIKRLP